jgi:hypothetical protein
MPGARRRVFYLYTQFRLLTETALRQARRSREQLNRERSLKTEGSWHPGSEFGSLNSLPWITANFLLKVAQCGKANSPGANRVRIAERRKQGLLAVLPG